MAVLLWEITPDIVLADGPDQPPGSTYFALTADLRQNVADVSCLCQPNFADAIVGLTAKFRLE
jgi:hypothetical protein